MKKLCKALKSNEIVERPNCQNSLKIMDLCALKLNDLKYDKEFIALKHEVILKDITIDESFHKYFIKKKVNLLQNCGSNKISDDIFSVNINYFLLCFIIIFVSIIIFYIHL